MDRVRVAGVLSVLLAVIFCQAGVAADAGTEAATKEPVLDQKLAVGDITIRYPTGLETQAKEVAEVCKTVIAPRREKLRGMGADKEQAKRAARAITQLLAHPELEELGVTTLTGIGDLVALMEPVFTDVRIYRQADLKACGGVSSGAVSLVYVPEEDRFHFTVGYKASGVVEEGKTTLEPLKGGFFPVIVKEDGTFRTADEDLGTFAGQMLDGLVLQMPAQAQLAGMQLVTTLVLMKACGTDPFTQWFVEGAGAWAMPQVMSQVAPERVAAAREMVRAEPPGPDERIKVNLLAWAFGEEARPGEASDEASQACAQQLVAQLFKGKPTDSLTRVMEKLKGEKPIDTDVILKALDGVLGGNARAALMEYVPKEVREGLKEGRAAKLREAGYDAIRNQKPKEAVKALREALRMTPSDVNMRVNLAIWVRKTGAEGEAVNREIKLAAMVAANQSTKGFLTVGRADEDTAYVLHKIAELRTGEEAGTADSAD